MMMVPHDARRVSRALRFAVRLHAGERNEEGMPYVLHPLAVGLALYPHAVGMMLGFLHGIAEVRVPLDTVEIAFGLDVREALVAFRCHNRHHPVARLALVACRRAAPRHGVARNPLLGDLT